MSTSKTHEAGAENLAHAAADRAKSYVDAGVNAYDAVSERARQLGQNADGYVRKNPWMAIAAAAGAGVILGILLGRRR